MARASPPGFGDREPSLGFTFEGRPVAAAPGESVAAALVAAGELALRATRAGDRRGPFCGMGVCFECLVHIDGETSRACMTQVSDGMKVAQHGPRLPAPAIIGDAAPAKTLTADVAIVGAGPAGLSAARAVAHRGLDALVLDERKQPGGQYYKQPAREFPVRETALDRQFRDGRELVRAARDAGARFLAEASVWAAQGDDLLVETPDGARRVRAKRIILATGAAERCPPFPGWTLPGVMTTGAAQTFIRTYGVAPGARVLICGSGPLNLQLAAELIAAGVRVVAVVESSARPGLAALPALARMTIAAPDLMREGLRYRARLLRAGVPVLHGMSIVAADGGGRIERARVAPLKPNGEPDHDAARAFECDALCIGYGFAPAIELAASMGCELAYDRRWRHLAVETTDDGRTSHPHVYAVGDGARFGGARIALAEGFLAGLSAARDLDPAAAANERDERAARMRLARARDFQRALWTLFDAPPPGLALAAPDTLVCRCEHVALRAIDDAVAAGARSLGAIKRATRLGMGRCQGRYCSGVVAAMLAARSDDVPTPEDFFAPRAPLRPVSVGAVASFEWKARR